MCVQSLRHKRGLVEGYYYVCSRSTVNSCKCHLEWANSLMNMFSRCTTGSLILLLFLESDVLAPDSTKKAPLTLHLKNTACNIIHRVWKLHLRTRVRYVSSWCDVRLHFSCLRSLQSYKPVKHVAVMSETSAAHPSLRRLSFKWRRRAEYITHPLSQKRQHPSAPQLSTCASGPEITWRQDGRLRTSCTEWIHKHQGQEEVVQILCTLLHQGLGHEPCL